MEKKTTELYGTVNLDMIKDFTEVNGISGQEKYATRVMKSYLEGYADEFDYDNLGSLIALKKGSGDGPKILLAGHIDEIGFVVREIDENGYIFVNQIGGWWGHVLPAQQMRITTREGKEYDAVFGVRAPHGLPADVRNKVMEVKDLFLDLGVSNKEEVEALGIRLGDMITPITQFKVMNNPNFWLAKAWDDRVGALIATEVVRNLKGVDHKADVYAAGTVQEEVGLRGAKTTAYKVKPDLSIALDVTLANDYPTGGSKCKMDMGVTVALQDGSHLAHRGFIEYVEDLCKELEIPVQYDQMIFGGTDSGEIHKSYEGVIAITISVPSRYCHSHCTLIHRRDYVDTVNMITELCKRMDNEILEKLRVSNR